MCHLYRLRIKTHVLTITMPCFIDSIIERQYSPQVKIEKSFNAKICLDFNWGRGYSPQVKIEKS